VLYGVGFLMPPAVGAAVMSVSTVIVAINAKLLERFQPKGAAASQQTNGGTP
jgi:Cu2+-exporting ATPase